MNLYGYVGNNPVLLIDPWGLAKIMVNVNSRNGLLINPGHAWVTITNDDGTYVSVGNYPGGPRPDTNRVATVSHTWEISQDQADAAYNVMAQPGYNFLSDNCVDRVEGALDASSIQHPSFNILGISDPNQAYNWINGK